VRGRLGDDFAAVIGMLVAKDFSGQALRAAKPVARGARRLAINISRRKEAAGDGGGRVSKTLKGRDDAFP